jgi:hypothetical protein
MRLSGAGQLHASHKVCGTQGILDSNPLGSYMNRQHGHIGSQRAKSPSMVKNLSGNRRTHRVQIAIPVLVYGNGDSGDTLNERTQTRVVNATGGLILLASKVVTGQKLLLHNISTGEEIICTVTSLLDETDGKVAVGIVFDQPSPRFWGLAFPPENWDPAHRKRPEQSHGLK